MVWELPASSPMAVDKDKAKQDKGRSPESGTEPPAARCRTNTQGDMAEGEAAASSGQGQGEG